jgi:uracil-DNA glycosylase
MDKSIIPKQIHHSWNDFMSDEIISIIHEIENEIGIEIKDYFPRKENVLRFLETDLNNIKVVILGMEPYPSWKVVNNSIIPEATGRSFEINSVSNWNEKFKQSSLRNILKAIYYNQTNKIIPLSQIRDEIESGTFNIKQPKEWFDSLEKQGVLFLNATLTVKPNKVDTHTKIWDDFMNKLISYISQNQNITWFLWGDKAQKRAISLIQKGKIICNCHPRLVEFVNENCFEKIPDINWLG